MSNTPYKIYERPSGPSIAMYAGDQYLTLQGIKHLPDPAAPTTATTTTTQQNQTHYPQHPPANYDQTQATQSHNLTTT